MPATLTGLLVFVVLLLPGFAYLVGKERNGAERQLSPFRETVAIVAASVTSELLVLLLFAVFRWAWPTLTPDVGELIRQGGRYVRGSGTHAGHYGQLTIWGAGLLAVACIFAYVATLPALPKVLCRLTGPYPHDSAVSAWWNVFARWPAGRDVEAICILEDGSMVRGTALSFNTISADSPDRDLVLTEPIYYRPPGDDEEHPYDVSAVTISASRIVTMFVNYTGTPEVTSSSAEEGQLAEASTAEPPPASTSGPL